MHEQIVDARALARNLGRELTSTSQLADLRRDVERHGQVGAHETTTATATDAAIHLIHVVLVAQLERIVEYRGHLEQLLDNRAVSLVELFRVEFDVRFRGHELRHALHEQDAIRLGVDLGGQVDVRIVAFDEPLEQLG